MQSGRAEVTLFTPLHHEELPFRVGDANVPGFFVRLGQEGEVHLMFIFLGYLHDLQP